MDVIKGLLLIKVSDFGHGNEFFSAIPQASETTQG